MNPLDLGFLCSLDSFVACALIGLAGGRRGDRWRLALAFGLCDAAASGAGLRWHGAAQQGALLAVAVALTAVVLATRYRPGPRWGVMLLPLLMSFDNLAAPSTGPAWGWIGLGSAAMAFAGFSVASMLRTAGRSLQQRLRLPQVPR